MLLIEWLQNGQLKTRPQSGETNLTTAQKLKEARNRLKVCNERKNHLAASERQGYKNDIVRLEALVEDRNDTFDKLHKAQNKLGDMEYRNAQLKNENKRLVRKLEFATKLYQEKLNEKNRTHTAERYEAENENVVTSV